MRKSSNFKKKKPFKLRKGFFNFKNPHKTTRTKPELNRRIGRPVPKFSIFSPVYHNYEANERHAKKKNARKLDFFKGAGTPFVSNNTTTKNYYQNNQKLENNNNNSNKDNYNYRTSESYVDTKTTNSSDSSKNWKVSKSTTNNRTNQKNIILTSDSVASSSTNNNKYKKNVSSGDNKFTRSKFSNRSQFSGNNEHSGKSNKYRSTAKEKSEKFPFYHKKKSPFINSINDPEPPFESHVQSLQHRKQWRQRIRQRFQEHVEDFVKKCEEKRFFIFSHSEKKLSKKLKHRKVPNLNFFKLRKILSFWKNKSWRKFFRRVDRRKFKEIKRFLKWFMFKSRSTRRYLRLKKSFKYATFLKKYVYPRYSVTDLHIHIRSVPNNIHLTLTDAYGHVFLSYNTGMAGFFGPNRGTTYAVRGTANGFLSAIIKFVRTYFFVKYRTILRYALLSMTRRLARKFKQYIRLNPYYSSTEYERYAKRMITLTVHFKSKDSSCLTAFYTMFFRLMNYKGRQDLLIRKISYRPPVPHSLGLRPKKPRRMLFQEALISLL